MGNRENLRSSKQLSLHPLKTEDAIGAALVTPRPATEKKQRQEKAKKSR